MSLVDYAASSDEDEPKELSGTEDKRRRFGVPPAGPSSPSTSANNDLAHAPNKKISGNLVQPSKQMEVGPNQSAELKLPDASLLFDSPAPPNVLNVLDHSSRVAAAMAESAARKRDLNGSPASGPRSKVPKMSIKHSKSVPDAVGGCLLPPQLAGRSNIVTEDISKLFVRKHANSSTE
ncbi:hypothetical protein BUALT_Bualt19G0045500 [Buddleja alternifolia]|uniref:Uncharacterized protein n=1 Tax=Buddleja alternifolia TaxID=168488 RepID=A0AAV6W1L2_9LAMI|nr:hypothetical protein BUALT_Bualt19G0045500 [Buddleja alternifolia]